MPYLDVTRRRWELLVVGAGTAGLLAAQTAASLGARVLLVDRGTWGGAGCLPSKALIAAGEAAAAVLASVRAAVREIEPVDSPEAQRAASVAVAEGQLVLTDPSSAALDGRRVRFRQAVVATGSAPALTR